MANIREPIYAALFTLLQTMIINGMPTPSFSRRFQSWDVVDVVACPYVIQQQFDEDAQQQAKQMMGLTLWESTVNVWIYFDASNPSAIPDQTYNNIMDALETALKPSSPTRKQTLGGLVINTWIEGKTLYSDGAQDGKAVILAQVKVLRQGM
jgi:hypothetical protein